MSSSVAAFHPCLPHQAAPLRSSLPRAPLAGLRTSQHPRAPRAGPRQQLLLGALPPLAAGGHPAGDGGLPLPCDRRRCVGRRRACVPARKQWGRRAQGLRDNGYTARAASSPPSSGPSPALCLAGAAALLRLQSCFAGPCQPASLFPPSPPDVLHAPIPPLPPTLAAPVNGPGANLACPAAAAGKPYLQAISTDESSLLELYAFNCSAAGDPANQVDLLQALDGSKAGAAPPAAAPAAAATRPPAGGGRGGGGGGDGGGGGGRNDAGAIAGVWDWMHAGTRGWAAPLLGCCVWSSGMPRPSGEHACRAPGIHVQSGAQCPANAAATMRLLLRLLVSTAARPPPPSDAAPPF
jgi:hypothetical protein